MPSSPSPQEQEQERDKEGGPSAVVDTAESERRPGARAGAGAGEDGREAVSWVPCHGMLRTGCVAPAAAAAALF